MTQPIPGQLEYDNREPAPSVDVESLVQHIYEDENELVNLIQMFVADHPEHAKELILSGNKSAFEDWYFWQNREEILENAA